MTTDSVRALAAFELSAGDAKVEDFHLAMDGEHDVGRLDVPVNHPEWTPIISQCLGVGHLECEAGLPNHLKRNGAGEPILEAKEQGIE